MPASRFVPSIVLAASLALIAAAFYFQYVVGLKPCELCLAERWPYYLAMGAAILALATGARASLWCAGFTVLLFALGAGLASYHVGVEQHWIAGPTACTGSGLGAATTPDELRAILEHAPARCDEVQWSLFGVSLAGWNLLASLSLLVFTGWGLRAILRERKS